MATTKITGAPKAFGFEPPRRLGALGHPAYRGAHDRISIAAAAGWRATQPGGDAGPTSTFRAAAGLVR